jgi:hypothetical protein
MDINIIYLKINNQISNNAHYKKFYNTQVMMIKNVSSAY